MSLLDRPKNQGPDGPNAEKFVKSDLPFEETVRRAMKAGKPSEPPKPRNGALRGRKAGPRGG